LILQNELPDVLNNVNMQTL